MSDFISMFLAVFLATSLGQIALEVYKRWAEKHVKKGFDKIDYFVGTNKTREVPVDEPKTE